MKQVNLILQSKGGVGKSLLTWFLANHYSDNNNVLFMDVDESTRTSSSRLASILSSSDRSLFYPILNEQKKLEREYFLSLFERISNLSTEQIFLDFGAPESEEFRKLLEYEISAEDLSIELSAMGISLALYIVIAGRDAFESCSRFLFSMRSIIGSHLKVKVLLNEGTFGGREDLNLVIERLSKMGISQIYPFGNLGESQSGRDIIELISIGKKPENLSLAMKLTFRKAMNQIEALLN
jgi:cellulose biosynthesis protein BcsQ